MNPGLRARLDALSPTDLGVPGPDLAQMARAFRTVRRDPVAYLSRVDAQYGDRVAFPVPGAPALLLSRPADVDRVLRGAARTWVKDTVQYAALARVTGPGLLASAEPDWIDHRRIAAPAFHRERLRAVGEQVRDVARETLAAALPGTGTVVDLAPVMHGIGLQAVGRALFSADLTGHAETLLATSGGAAALIVKLGRSVVPGVRWAPTPTTVRLERTRRRLDTVAAELIAQRRAATAGGETGDDLLGLLLAAGMSDAQVRDELITMVIAGHETVAAALSWTVMLLAEHRGVQDQVRAELAALPAPAAMGDPRSTVPVTRSVVDEALRLYPPAWVVSRRATAADRLGDLDVPAGTLAIISPWVMHRRPELWDAPLEFRPERFRQTPTPTGYLPFGLGPRLCIGREFALGEMVLVLDELLRGHRVETGPGWRRPAPETLVAIHPAGGMPLVVREL